MPNGRYPVGTRLILTCHDHANRYFPEKRNFTCTNYYGWFPAVPYYTWCVLSHGKYAFHSLKFLFTIYTIEYSEFFSRKGVKFIHNNNFVTHAFCANHTDSIEADKKTKLTPKYAIKSVQF